MNDPRWDIPRQALRGEDAQGAEEQTEGGQATEEPLKVTPLFKD